MRFFYVLSLFLIAGVLCCGVTDCRCRTIDGPGNPIVFFTHVPALGSVDDLRGLVQHVTPEDYRVAVYIFVENAGRQDPTGLFGSAVSGGWWNKPTWDTPSTEIACDGNWTADITTGGNDDFARKIAAFLVPSSYTPPLLSGDAELPQELLDSSVSHVAMERTIAGNARLLYFAGYEWRVKASDGPVGPGPNVFSDSIDNVWVDTDGRLHLKIKRQGNTYHCAEIILTKSLGYGTYIFNVASPVSDFDPNVILGLFLWSDDPAYHYREMDIEFSRWGDPQNLGGQFVIQPWDTAGNLERFAVPPGSTSSHGFTWMPDAVDFASVCGLDYWTTGPNQLIHSWSYTGADIPPPGDESVRMNLWLMWGYAPIDGEEVEVVVSDFHFIQP